jgi:uncharacterized protein DUF2752
MLVDRDTTLLSSEPLPHDELSRDHPQAERSSAGVLPAGQLEAGASPGVPFERPFRRGRRWAPLFTSGHLKRAALVALSCTGVALVLHFELWRCPIAELFGLPCPGCGLTRAASALLRGDFAGAIRLHPLTPLVVPLAAVMVSREALRFVRGGPPALRAEDGARERRQRQRRVAQGNWRASGARWLDRASVCVAVLLLGVWVLRFFGVFGGPVPVSSHLFG